MNKILLFAVSMVLLTLVIPEEDAQSSGRWVVCFRVEVIKGAASINQTCIRCALADSGGYSYVYPGSSGNMCAGSRGSDWRSFATRDEAVRWININCGCRSSANVPSPN